MIDALQFYNILKTDYQLRFPKTNNNSQRIFNQQNNS